MKRIAFFLFVSVLAIGCQSRRAITSRVSPNDIVLKIIQINDVYEIDAINNGKNGGLARVAWIRDSVAKENPNTWYFLAGDFVNPSLLGTIKVDGERLQGKQMVEVLNASKLDLVTFGNHEFDIKEEDLQKRMNESLFEWISANVLQVTAEGNYPFYKETAEGKDFAKDYVVYSAGNAKGDSLRFGVFGVTIPSNPQSFVQYGDMFEESVRAYNEVSEKTDFVLGLTHLSIEQDQQLAEMLQEVPLLMGGHEHNNMKVKVGKSVITKADANVVSLYLHTLVYSPTTKNLKIHSELIEVDDKIPFLPEVQTVVDKWNALLDENLKTLIDNPNEVIFHTKEPLDGTDEASRGEQTNLGEIIGQAMAWAHDDKVDAAFSNGGGIRIDDKLDGQVTSKDVFRILPYGGKVLLVEMTGQLLKETLDFGVQAEGTGAYLQHHLIRQNRKGEWLINGKVLDSESTYKIAMNDFLMMGLDIPFLKESHEGVLGVYAPEEETVAGDLRKSIIHYLKSKN